MGRCRSEFSRLFVFLCLELSATRTPLDARRFRMRIFFLLFFAQGTFGVIFCRPAVSTTPIVVTPLDQVSDIRAANSKQAVVVGAGIAGLTAALVLAHEGFSVVILEKRTADFDRFNIVNLKAECGTILHKLGLFDDFVNHLATRLKVQRYFRFEGDRYVEFKRETLSGFPVSEKFSFEAEDIADLFRAGGIYAVSIAEFQQFLAAAALRTGAVSIVTEVKITLRGNEDKGVLATQGTTKREFSPHLIVLADGTGKNRVKSEQGEELVEETVDLKHPSDGELWVFGNVSYTGKNAFVTILIDPSSKTETQIANVIFDPRRKSANVAVSVTSREVSEEAIAAQIQTVAKTAFSLSGLKEKIDVRSISKVVRISNRIGKKFSLGKNLILVGDRAGASSPLAGLGASLATTTYPYGVGLVARALLSECDHQVSQAFETYSALARASVLKWFEASREVRTFIADHLKPRSGDLK